MTQKKRFIILIAVFIILVGIRVWDVIDIHTSSRNGHWGIDMEVEDVSRSGLTLHMTRSEDGEDVVLTTGEPYSIQRRMKFGWKTIPVSMAFDAPLYYIEEGASMTWKLGWEHAYGKLPMGTYRIVKNVTTEHYHEYSSVDEGESWQRYYAVFRIYSIAEYLMLGMIVAAVAVLFWQILCMTKMGRKLVAVNRKKLMIFAGIVLGGAIILSVVYTELQAPICNLIHGINTTVVETTPTSIDGVAVYSGNGMKEKNLIDECIIEKRTIWGWKDIATIKCGDKFTKRLHSGTLPEGEYEFHVDWPEVGELSKGRYRIHHSLSKKGKDGYRIVGAGSWYIPFTVKDEVAD